MSNRNRVNVGMPTIPQRATLIDPKNAPPAMHVDPKAFEADFQPTRDLVLLRELKSKRTAGNIEMPEGASDGRPLRYQVVKVGPGEFDFRKNDGTLLKIDERIKPGAVIYPVMGHHISWEIGKEKYVVTQAGQICGLSSAPPESL